MSCEPLSPQRAADIRAAINAKYKAVSERPDGHFPYPIGRESALQLGYEAAWIDGVPEEITNRFVGVGNPFSIRVPFPGEHVLDVGCGCGMDTVVAASLVGPTGYAVGVDLTSEMMEVARKAAAKGALGNACFLKGSVESLPFHDETFDLIISNGALNLALDKPAAFGEIARVLRPGGALASADLLVMETLPQEVLANEDAWST